MDKDAALFHMDKDAFNGLRVKVIADRLNLKGIRNFSFINHDY